jgi:type IV fimbrial biogenesis protein FimT
VLTRRRAGFTLIELLVTIAIVGTLMMMGVPYMGDWVRRAGVRTAAESIQNGIRMAQQEAIRRNTAVEFALMDSLPTAANVPTAEISKATSGWKAWVVRVTGGGDFVQGDNVFANAANAAFTSSATEVNALRFSGFGQVRDSSDAVLSDAAVYRIASSEVTEVRCVVVTPGAAVKMCDPSKDASDPRGCGSFASSCALK